MACTDVSNINNCHSYCGGDCTGACAGGASADTPYPCDGNCSSYCADGCYQDCGSSCTQNCSVCGGDCTSYCASDCNGHCSGACKESCDTTCNYACIGKTQTMNINKLILNKRLTAEDISNIIKAIKFEVEDRRGQIVINNVVIQQKEKIDDGKMNKIIDNIDAIGEKPIYSAQVKQKAIQDLPEDIITKIKTAYNEIIPLK